MAAVALRDVEQLVDGEGLAQHGGGSRVRRRPDLAGDEHGGDVVELRMRPHPVQHFGARHLRHHVVEEDDAGHLLATQEGERFSTRGGEADLVALAGEDVLQRFAGIRVVVDDQHAGHLASPTSSRGHSKPCCVALRDAYFYLLQVLHYQRKGSPSVSGGGPWLRLRAEGIEPSTYGLRVLGWTGAPCEAPWQTGPLLPRLAP